MALIRMEAPPLPYYISSSPLSYPPNSKHPNRCSIGIFDLLAVRKGCLFIGEDERSYEVPADHALLLRPDCHHFATKGCEETTDYYWVHFNTMGSWSIAEEDPSADADISGTANAAGSTYACTPDYFTPQSFHITLPQFTRLRQPDQLFEDLERLSLLETNAHLGSVRWEQQQLFQRILRQLSASAEAAGSTPSKLCAQQAATYLRKNYRAPITSQEMGEELNFHPVYIARCMQKEFGCSPFEYLSRFRIEQAKLLMVHTDLPIARIAEEVGFMQAAYFSTCFHKYEGVTPRGYRKRFSALL